MSKIEDEGYVVTVTTGPIEGYDNGQTIVVFQGTADNGAEGETITFGVDHRMADDIIAAVNNEDEGNMALCFVEDWQIIRHPL
jgi:hypothetical protein